MKSKSDEPITQISVRSKQRASANGSPRSKWAPSSTTYCVSLPASARHSQFQTATPQNKDIRATVECFARTQRTWRREHGGILLFLKHHNLVLKGHTNNISWLLLVSKSVRLARESGHERAVWPSLQLCLSKATVRSNCIEIARVPMDISCEALVPPNELNLIVNTSK